MPHQYTHTTLHSPVVLRKPLLSVTDEQELVAKQPDIVRLQQQIGNQGVQRLLAQGRLSSHGIVQKKPDIQRCGCGGSCAACKGQDEEVTVSAGVGEPVQRFWDDEEEEGGSWLDDATDWVSDTASDAADWISGGSSGSETSDESGGSWLDDATDWVSDKAGDAADWASDTWNDWTGGGEEEEDSDWLPDWLPDIDIPSLTDEEEEEPIDPEELVVEVEGDTGQAVCMSEEVGHGGGSTGGVSVSGLTKVDWSATTGKGSFLNPKIATRKVGNKTVYDVSGKVHIDYSGAEPSVSFTVNPPMSQLSECKQEKVNAFKGSNGDLGKHEAEHVAKMKTFNGSEEFDHTFTGLEASSTDDLTAKVNAALTAVVDPKIKARQAAAQKASDDLDPWSKPIPGIEKCP
jgi:hypothetical protein